MFTHLVVVLCENANHVGLFKITYVVLNRLRAFDSSCLCHRKVWVKLEKFVNLRHNTSDAFMNENTIKEALKKDGISFARNSKIQNMLRMIGFGENVGSGFPKILAAWKETDWGEPQLLNKLDVDEVELVLPLPLPNVVKDVVKDVVKELPERQRFVLEIIKLDPYISAKAIAEQITEKDSGRTKVTSRTIQRDLANLQKIGILTREGGRKDGRWVIVE